MWSEYLLEFIDDLDRQGIDHELIVEEVMSRWDVDREVIEEIVKYNKK